MLRLSTYLSLTVFLGLILWHFSMSEKRESHNVQVFIDNTPSESTTPIASEQSGGQWRTYAKEQKGRAPASYSTTQEEKEALKLGEKSELAALVTPIFEDRHLIGDPRVLKLGLKEIKKIERINNPSDDWEDQLSTELLRFHDRDTKLFIRPERGLIRIEGDKMRFVEEVVVSFVTERKGQTSFKALVDSETGKVLATWDQTVQENLPSLFKRKRGLTPTGGLRSEL
jgi:hypothetical protein